MPSPVWLRKSVVLAIHDEQLAEHGGAEGLRDEALLESALARPLMKLQYGTDDLATLAAAYAYGLVVDHPFVDGNKRTSLVVTETFLLLNGAELVVDDEALVLFWLRMAAGEVKEPDVATWIAAHLRLPDV